MPLLLILLACKGGEDSEGEPPPIGGEDTYGPCPGHAPALDALTLANGGLVAFEGKDYPTLQIATNATDEDGNLDLVTLELWWDDDANGEVDTSGSAKISKSYSPVEDGEPCAVNAAEIRLNIQVGEGLAYNTNYDVAARITDAEAEVSNVVTATGSTPKQNGTDGDGTGP